MPAIPACYTKGLRIHFPTILDSTHHAHPSLETLPLTLTRPLPRLPPTNGMPHDHPTASESASGRLTSRGPNPSSVVGVGGRSECSLDAGQRLKARLCPPPDG